MEIGCRADVTLEAIQKYENAAALAVVVLLCAGLIRHDGGRVELLCLRVPSPHIRPLCVTTFNCNYCGVVHGNRAPTVMRAKPLEA